MNISVRVLSAAARSQIAALQAQVKSLQGQLATAGAAGSGAGAIGGARSRKTLAAYGSQLQWTGRQLQYNFTLPILLAAGAATKFALDNEKAMTHVRKVYGDATDAQAQFRKEGLSAQDAQIKQQRVFRNETDALGKAFEALSSHYGVQQKEVIETAGAWAAAGVSGKQLAESTELSIKAAILGDMSLEKATESLIAIQSQYSLSTKQLYLTLAELNAVENQTGISMQGLIDGMSRAAGTARESGIDVRHLAAMMAALVPATGSASTAGNALKTIISRLLSPTKDAADVMREFGVNTADAAWQSSTAMERLEILAGHMGGSLEKAGKSGYKLSDSQKQVVASVLGSRYQMNRFLVLMRELDSENGYYQKALNATANNQKVFKQATTELNAVLNSSPQRLKILWTTLQNGMADAIQPFIPYLLYMVHLLTQMMQAFGRLDPSFQKLIILFLLLVAAAGPILKMWGSMLTLLGTMGGALAWAAKGFMGLFVTQVVTAEGSNLVAASWLRMIGTMLLLPFRAVGIGFAFIGSAAWAGTKAVFAATRALPLIVAMSMTTARSLVVVWQTAWVAVSAATTAGLAMMRVMLTLGAAGGISIWTRFSAGFRIINVAMWTSVRAIWAAGFASLRILAATSLRGILAFVGRTMLAIGSAFLGPWGLAIAAVVLLFVAFRKQLAQIWNNLVSYFADSNNAVVSGIISAWNMLPQGIANALTAVVRIVASAAQQVYEWLSYLNPFAHHSPSLVENVTKGMDVVDQQFARMRNIKGHLTSAYAAIRAFGNASAGLIKNADAVEVAQNRATVKKFAPGALGAFDRMISSLRVLKADLKSIEGPMNRQQQIVDAWTGKVDKANHALDLQQRILDSLTKVQDKWQASLDEAQGRLDKYTSAQITGQRAMSDAIFENEIAQKRLRLEMMKMEDVSGTLDDVRAKMEAINGAQEMLRGEQAGLRGAGAGSEILSQYDDQIKALEEQKKAYTAASKPLQDMQDQLDALERKGEELDLTNSLQFDPLTRQIEQASQALNEMPFDDIMAGVKGAAADVTKYQASLDKATDAVKAQQAVVDQYTAVRDRYQQSLDDENYKLGLIKKRYDEISEAIDKINSAVGDTTGAADSLKQAKDAKGAGAKAKKGKKDYVSPAVQNFRDAAGGNFADVGGKSGIPMRKDWTDQSKDILAGISKDAADSFSKLNPFSGLKKKWDQFKGWISGVFDNIKSIASDFFGHLFDGVSIGGGGGGFQKFVDKIAARWPKVQQFFDNAMKHIRRAWNAFWPPIKEVAQNAWEGIVAAWDKVWPEIQKFGKEFKDLGPAIHGFWNIVKVVIAFVVGRLMFLGLIATRILGNVIKPAFEMLGGVVKGALRIIRGAFQIISGFFMLFSGDSDAFKAGLKKMLAGVGNILGGLGGILGSILKGAFKIAIGIVVGFVKGVGDWFKWLYSELPPGVQGFIDKVVKIFKVLWKIVSWIWQNVLGPIVSLFFKFIGVAIAPFRLLWPLITGALKILWTLGVWFWEHVLKGIWDKVVLLWTVVSAAFRLWWAGIQTEWAILKTLAVWLWNNVLAPVLASVVGLWNNFVKPALAAWWTGIKTAWAILKFMGGWLWTNVLKPAYDKVKALWDNWVKPALATWWAGIKNVWNTLKTLATWVWTNILSPVWTKVKDLWTNAKASFQGWFGGIKTAWNTLKTLGTWVKTNVMDPVFDRIKGGWEKVRDWLSDAKGMLTNPVKGIVNTVIKGVNKLISGLNKISDVLPGIDFHIGAIPELAQGGPIPKRRVGGGFKTNGARAIVGEGKANHPEYVIPTDPTHRRRALGLLGQAAGKLGIGMPMGDRGNNTPGRAVQTFVDGVPAYSIGGVLGNVMGDAKNLIKGAGSWAKGNLHKIASTLASPFFGAAKGLINNVDWSVPRGIGRYGIKKAEDWVAGADEAAYNKATAVNKLKDAASGGDALKWARSQVGKPYKWGAVGPSGYDCSGFMSALTNVLRKKPPFHRVGTTGNFPWAGFTPGTGGKFSIGSTTNYGGSGVGHMAGTLAGVNVESAGGVGVRVGASARGANDGGFSTRAHLKEGGIALANRGPALAEIADGRYDEAVVPLPKGWRSDLIGGSSGGDTINIYGNLEFPNITDPDDAEGFIENLKNVGRP